MISWGNMVEKKKLNIKFENGCSLALIVQLVFHRFKNCAESEHTLAPTNIQTSGPPWGNGPDLRFYTALNNRVRLKVYSFNLRKTNVYRSADLDGITPSSSQFVIFKFSTATKNLFSLCHEYVSVQNFHLLNCLFVSATVGGAEGSSQSTRDNQKCPSQKHNTVTHGGVQGQIVQNTITLTQG